LLCLNLLHIAASHALLLPLKFDLSTPLCLYYLTHNSTLIIIIPQTQFCDTHLHIPFHLTMPETFTVKVEEGRPATDGNPSAGPVYRSIYAKDGLLEVPSDLESPWDFFRSVHTVMLIFLSLPHPCSQLKIHPSLSLGNFYPFSCVYDTDKHHNANHSGNLF